MSCGKRNCSCASCRSSSRRYNHSKESFAKTPKRRIDGKAFARVATNIQLKDTARAMAERLRQTGHLARVIPVKDGYSLYYRGGRRYNRFDPTMIPPNRDIYHLQRHNQLESQGRSLGVQPQINQRHGLRYDSTIFHVGAPKPMVMTGGLGVPADQLRQVLDDDPDNPALGWVYPVYAEDLNYDYRQDGAQLPELLQQMPPHAYKLQRAAAIMNALNEKYGDRQFFETARQFLPEWTWDDDDANTRRMVVGGELEMRVFMESLADLVQYYIDDDPMNYEELGTLIGSNIGATTPKGFVNSETGEFVNVIGIDRTGDINTYNRKKEPYDRNKIRKEMRLGNKKTKRQEIFDMLEEAMDDRTHGDEYLAASASAVDDELKLGVLPIDLSVVRKRLYEIRESFLHDQGERDYNRTYNNPAWFSGQRLPEWASDKNEDGFDDAIE
jgi:hypothetical protein